MRETKYRAWDNTEITNSDEYNSLWEFFQDCRDCKLMQYTGLKDKNGKEIYEGDILGNTYGHRSEVIWSESRAGYWIRRLNWERNGEDTWHILTFSAEIIGNIYEHPNLLQANQESTK